MSRTNHYRVHGISKWWLRRATWPGANITGATVEVAACEGSSTHLENLFNMRPLGVVSKKFMGDRKIAWAILSCNLREACTHALACVPVRLATAEPNVDAGRSMQLDESSSAQYAPRSSRISRGSACSTPPSRQSQRRTQSIHPSTLLRWGCRRCVRWSSTGKSVNFVNKRQIERPYLAPVLQPPRTTFHRRSISVPVQRAYAMHASAHRACLSS